MRRVRRHGWARLAVLVFAVSAGIPTHPSWANSNAITRWAQFGFSPEHASENPFEQILGPGNVFNLGVKWSGPSDLNPICCSSPVVVNGVVYVGTGDNRLRAYRSSDGTILWNANVGGGQVSTPAVSNDTVFVGSGDWNLYAFDIATGLQRWAYKTGGPVIGGPTVVGDTVYTGSDDGFVYALNAADGTIRWSRLIGGEIEHSPTVSNGILYVGNFTGSFYLFALDANTGARKWRTPTGGYLDWNTPAVSGNMVFAASVDGEAYAFDAATGAQVWQVTLPSLVEASPAVGEGTVYLGTYDGYLYALDASTGTKRWRVGTGNLIAGTATVARGVVYVGSTDNHVYGFGAGTGIPLWRAALGGPVQFSQPVVVNSRVFVAADRLYAFGLP